MATFVNFGDARNDYHTWLNDNTLYQEANTAAKGRYMDNWQAQINTASDTSAFEAQAASLGYGTDSDYYTRGVQGIQQGANDLVTQRDEGATAFDNLTTAYQQDRQDIKSGSTAYLLGSSRANEGWQAHATMIPTGLENRRLYTYRDYVAEHKKYVSERNSSPAYFNPYAGQTNMAYLPAGSSKFKMYPGSSPISQDKYYQHAFGDIKIDPTVRKQLATDESNRLHDEQLAMASAASAEASGEATKFAGQATKGGGAQFEQTVPVEMDTEEEVAGWWS